MTGMSQRFEMRLSDELVASIDEARGEVPRATWVKSAINLRLGRSPQTVAAQAAGLGEWVERGEVRTAGVSAAQVRAEVPSCPECAGDFVVRDGRWLCGDCGRPR